MSGINDIKNAFAKAAPGLDLRAVRMRYEGSETVLEFDICRADGAKQTVEERLPLTAGMTPLLDAAMKVAKVLGAQVEDNRSQPVSSEEKTSPSLLAEKAAEGIAKLVSEPVSAAVEIEHQGEKYELAHDGSPSTLFF